MSIGPYMSSPRTPAAETGDGFDLHGVFIDLIRRNEVTVDANLWRPKCEVRTVEVRPKWGGNFGGLLREKGGGSFLGLDAPNAKRRGTNTRQQAPTRKT